MKGTIYSVIMKSYISIEQIKNDYLQDLPRYAVETLENQYILYVIDSTSEIVEGVYRLYLRRQFERDLELFERSFPRFLED